MPTDPVDPLLEAALSVSDARPVEWDRMRREIPGEEQTVAGLEALAAIGAVLTGADPAPEVEACIAFRWGSLQARRLLGQGSYGEVWEAWDPALQRDVALKLQSGSLADPRRWLAEARRLARVRHPNVVTVHGADEHNGRTGLWMDRVQGSTLEEVLARSGPLGAREAALVGIELCGALAAVHAVNLAHGDLKTRNVMREGTPEHPAAAGRIVLMDFGSAHEHAVDLPPEGSRGTPLYAAPELLRGGRPTPGTDLYALGVLLYRLVTGTYPVEAASVDELRDRLDHGQITPLRSVRPDLAPAFVHAIERALEKHPEKRFRDAAEMERALAAVLGSGERQARSRAPRTTFIALVAVGALVGALGLWAGERWPVWFAPRFTVAPTGPPIATTLQGSIQGTEFHGYLGIPLVAAGDVNGDSIPDLLVGAAGENHHRGVAHLYYGRRGALPEPGLCLAGEDGAESFGQTIAAGGDLNGDGYGDFAIADPQFDAGGRDVGRVYIWFGGPGLQSGAELVLSGTRPGQIFGFWLSCSGDVNGDGRDDLIIGAPGDASAGQATGAAYLFYGGDPMDSLPDLTLTRAVSNAQFGVTAELGDLNSDGFADMVVSANWDNTDAPFAGRIYVYMGGRSPDAQPDLTLAGPGERAYFGHPVCVADFNGDGYADIAARHYAYEGARGDNRQVSLYFGAPRPDPHPDLVFMGNGTNFADRLQVAGDVNGDGLTDLFVAGWGEIDAKTGGSAYVYYGGRDMDAVADLQLLGQGGAQPYFGWCGVGCGDLNGDGFGDLAIGSPYLGSNSDIASGRIDFFDCSRYAFMRPRPNEIWHPGTETTLSWAGAEPADVALSSDGGRSFQTVLSRVGGTAENAVALQIPSNLANFVLVRLAPHRSGVRGQAVVGPVLIAP